MFDFETKSMRIKDITDYLETLAPLSLQESYDNSGLIVGNYQTPVKKVLIALDATEAVIEEAHRNKCQLIIVHHPIIFSGIKKLNGKNYIERVVISAIKNNIAIYAIHTNYDNIAAGVNAKICEQLGLTDCEILLPKKQLLKKLYTYIPDGHYEKVTAAIFNAGAGFIGNYSETSFSVAGTGTFKGNDKSKPTVGKRNQLEKVSEIKFETVFPAFLESKVIAALLAAHPYEEVAYDIITLDNTHTQIGSGMVGNLKKPIAEMAFLKLVKKNFNAGCIRYTTLLGKPIKRVAVCGGSGRFLLEHAIAAQADIFITSDFKYHDFFDADNKIVVVDIGHYESEQFTKDLLFEHLSKKFPILAAQISNVQTNPLKYL